MFRNINIKYDIIVYNTNSDEKKSRRQEIPMNTYRE